MLKVLKTQDKTYIQARKSAEDKVCAWPRAWPRDSVAGCAA
jgi:hypothetical protein